MNDDAKMESLLKWRRDRASEEAPPPPRASALLARSRPWWETAPDVWNEAIERLRSMQLVPGHAMSSNSESKPGHPVPVLDLRGDPGLETSARILYFSVREGRLRMRFAFAEDGTPPADDLELAIVPDDSDGQLLAHAVLAGDREYRLDVSLPGPVAARWSGLRVTDRMPFRFILGPEKPLD